ncbi:hypothetical protein C7Y72_19910 [Paraconexibacter algicola]|uniref:Uncharacterized protein n=1 Tax=Paraconexibacter algicola TaxID=2133960 RepID=A0A2T4UCB6_9ACTN|nr:hypothetical protein C7Y72_19910 [Paraconexibacter algicola]
MDLAKLLRPAALDGLERQARDRARVRDPAPDRRAARRRRADRRQRRARPQRDARGRTRSRSADHRGQRHRVPGLRADGRRAHRRGLDRRRQLRRHPGRAARTDGHAARRRPARRLQPARRARDVSGRRARRRLAAVAGAAALAALAGCGGGEQPVRTLDPPAHRGVAVDIVFGTPASAELAEVDAAAELGADAIRVAVQWAGMEPLRAGELADWYVQRLDGLVARARRAGLQVLLTPVFTPCWAVDAAGGAPCASPAAAQQVQTTHPRDPADYARFAGRLARRYGDALAGLEVWNEPNLPGFWAPQDAARDYVRLVRATRQELLRVAPRLPLVAGALAGGDAPFLEQLYGEGLADEIDVLSVHAYNDGRPPERGLPARFARAAFRQGLLAVKGVVERRDAGRTVWVTEIGWNTSTQRGELFNDGVGEAEQAAYLGRALARLQAPGTALGFPESVFVYRLRDPRQAPADPQQNYGLIAADGRRKPAFAAVRRAFAARRG